MSKPKRLLATKHVEEESKPAAGDIATEHKRAVIYLRVSTPSQVKTDYNPEGISLPAQRDACELKASSLGADTVREFVEPGRTATSIDKRPVFQEMLIWIKSQKDIDFVICYQFNRVFRDSIDALITKKDLSRYGTRVVSTSMDLGEGPESSMVEAILHAVDEYRSKADGADIAYKMGAKARNGGTVGRAPLGYLNARDLSEGRNIGIVTFDPERQSLIRTAFELFATGDYSLESLSEELTRRGLRTRPARFPGGPISTSKLSELLRDPYYIGFVTYKGELIQGRHERLIDDELFDKVQEILDSRGGRGERQRRHYHYLKGSVWCGRCHDEGVESRMIMQWANGNGGKYLYYFCRRKQQHLCNTRYVEGDALERAALDFYGTVQFPGELADRMRTLMHEALEEEERSCKLLHQQLTSELSRLDRQEENLLDLVADGSESSDKVKKRLNAILRKKSKLTEELGQTGERLAVGAALIENALVLLHDPKTMYEQMGPEQRRLMNQAIFEKLYVIEDTITDAVFNPPFDELVQAKAALSIDLATAAAGELPSGSLAAALSDDGSNKRVVVEVSGQLSNHAITERINALWSLTRANVQSEVAELASPEPQPVLCTPKRVLRRLGPTEEEDLIQGYISGVPVDQLASRFQVDQSTVQKHVRRHGIPRRSPRLGPRQIEEAKRLYLAGQSLAKLSEHFGVASGTVGLALRRSGVTLRPRQGWTQRD